MTQVLSEYSGEFHKFSRDIRGSMKTLHAIFGRDGIMSDKATINPVQCIEVRVRNCYKLGYYKLRKLGPYD